MTLQTEIRVSLLVPVPVTGADGKEAKRDTITLRRPKTRHVKRLAVLLGVDLARMLLSEEDADGEAALTEAGQADRNRKVALDLVATLLSQDRLDALTALIADLCNEDAGFIDDVDVVDLLEIGKAFLGFFPSLQSLAHSIMPPKSPSSTDGDPQT